MKYREILTEHAFPLSRITRRIDEVELRISDHVMKLFYFSDGPRQHWADELYAFARSFSTMRWKKSNKQPDAKFYMYNLFEARMGNDGVVDRENIDLFMQELKGDARYKKLTPKKKFNYDTITKFYSELSRLLATGQTTIADVRKSAKILD